MPDGKWFRFGYGIVILFLIIYLGTLIDFIFRPIVVLVQTLFAPIILAGVMYYVARPFVSLLSKKIPRGLSILLLYLGAVAFFTVLILLIGPELQRQFNSLVRNTPFLVNEIRDYVIKLQQTEWFTRFQATENISLEELTTRFGSYINEFVSALGTNVAAFIGFITNIIIIIVIIPFVLYYMLKDGEKAPEQVLRFLPEKQQQNGIEILGDMDKALSSYIQGQIIVSFCVGVLAYIGYLIIGLEYSLVLALIAMFTNVIPFVGPWIGTFPAVIVGLLTSPLMGLFVVIVVVIVQQIESNFISPQVMGRKLAIHPLTIILLLLVAGKFAGLLGLIFAVPAYAVGKVIISHTYRLWKLRHRPLSE